MPQARRNLFKKWRISLMDLSTLTWCCSVQQNQSYRTSKPIQMVKLSKMKRQPLLLWWIVWVETSGHSLLYWLLPRSRSGWLSRKVSLSLLTTILRTQWSLWWREFHYSNQRKEMMITKGQRLSLRSSCLKLSAIFSPSRGTTS